jgi:elongator complex protein 3
MSIVDCCAEIVKELISSLKENKNVDLNALKTRISKKMKLKNTPKLGKLEYYDYYKRISNPS